MENEIYKPKERHNYPGILEFLKRYKYNNAAKRQHDHHGRRPKNHIISSNNNNNKVKPGDTYKINPHTFHEEHNFEATHGNKQDFADLQDLNKVSSQSGKDMEEFNKMSNKQVKHHRNHSNNGCFKALFLFSAPKKKKLPARISSLEPQTTQLEGVERDLDKSKSFDKIPSLGSMSINEQRTKTPNNSRTPSLNRTSSTFNRTNSMKNSGPLNRSTTSIGRSTSDVNAKFRRASNVTKSGPIMFSNSSGMLKPPPSEEQLECTLDELYHGCVKRIKVSRRVYTFTGHIKHQDEILTVNIKPGWKTGTKITFNGTPNDDRPGEMPGDIIFIITEKQHPLFRRIDDDLELEIDIPLVDALTGCNLNIPLLGKDNMSLEINDIIYPGHEKVIVGQGMPNQKNPNQLGDLKVKFLINYPNNLTDEQRFEISRILSD